VQPIINAQKIRELRVQKNWEQKDLAAASSVTASVISRLERGLQNDFKVSVLVNIATALGVPVDALLIPTQEELRVEALIPELQAVLNDLSHQPPKVQRHGASVIRGFLAGLTEQVPD
jgi:transcriptional regulator with XRE-family HTH domain